MDRDRFDYARILIASSSLEIVQRCESLLVDGEVVEVKIVEEWGFSIGEDACLFEEREGSRFTQSNQEETVEDVDHDIEANVFVDQIMEELRGEEDREDPKEREGNVMETGSANVDKVYSTPVEKLNDSVAEEDASFATSTECPSASVNGDNQRDVSEGGGNHDAVQTSITSPLQGTQVSCRSSSCPHNATRSLASGPWSLEWLSDPHHSEAGVVSSSRKDGNKRVRWSKKKGQADKFHQKRKKIFGFLCHPVLSLKKVARLSMCDRAAVLQILKKYSRRARAAARLKKAVQMISQDLSEKEASSGSVYKEWNNWVVPHGNDKVMEDDVKNIGVAIRVQLNERNMFGVLARKGKGKKTGDEGEVLEVESMVKV